MHNFVLKWFTIKITNHLKYTSDTLFSCCMVGSVTWRFVTQDDIVTRGQMLIKCDKSDVTLPSCNN